MRRYAPYDVSACPPAQAARVCVIEPAVDRGVSMGELSMSGE